MAAPAAPGVRPGRPPPRRAEYSLTDKGRALGEVMDALYDWGMAQTPDLTAD